MVYPQGFPGWPVGKHRIVVSAENNGYIGWQRKVFYYSCVTRTSFQPLFIVHAMGSEWHPDSHELVKAGALVRSAPSYIRIPLCPHPAALNARTPRPARRIAGRGV